MLQFIYFFNTLLTILSFLQTKCYISQKSYYRTFKKFTLCKRSPRDKINWILVFIDVGYLTSEFICQRLSAPIAVTLTYLLCEVFQQQKSDIKMLSIKSFSHIICPHFGILCHSVRRDYSTKIYVFKIL